ncbi:MAG: hypothetical protein KDB23_07865, partial [Planctomycetales bacterium]|nr:hypothetical protein [Planctomycetales bacterium]
GSGDAVVSLNLVGARFEDLTSCNVSNTTHQASGYCVEYSQDIETLTLDNAVLSPAAFNAILAQAPNAKVLSLVGLAFAHELPQDLSTQIAGVGPRTVVVDEGLFARFAAEFELFASEPGQELSVLGDFDGNRQLTVDDLDQLTLAIRSGVNERRFDLTGDTLVTADDQLAWVHQLKHTYVGDANLDGRFDSADFVQIFAAGQYEDDIVNNSTWSTGDWNADGEFSSSDLVQAFQDGGYEVQANANAVQAVPEPATSGAAIMALLISTLATRRRSAA